MVEFVTSKTGLALYVVDQATLGSGGPCSGHPPLEAARTARGQQVVQSGTDCFRDEVRVLGYLRDVERLVPAAAFEQCSRPREQSRPRWTVRLLEASNQQF